MSMTMNDALRWELENADDAKVVRIFGAVTEDSELDRLANELKGETCVRFFLDGLTRINSVGVRDWIMFLEKVSQTSEVELAGCPAVFVAQMNMISNFVRGAKVLSIHVPFYCEACDSETFVVIDVSDGRIPSILPAPKCGADGAEMVFDDLPDLYFRFLKTPSSAVAV